MPSPLSGGLEENVLSALGWDDKYSSTIALRLTADLFSKRPYRLIARACLEHIEKYRLPPRIHLRDIFENAKGDEGDTIRDILTQMEQLFKHLQIQYVLNELDRFIESRYLSHALQEAADLLHAGKPEAAREAMYRAERVKAADDGIWLSDPEQALSFLNRKDAEPFTSGIEAVDSLGVRPARKELFVLMAETNKGKSWFLVELGKRTLTSRHGVLHITLELSAEHTAQRYVQNLFSLTSREADPVRVTRFDRRDGTISFDLDYIKPEQLSEENRAKIAKQLSGLKSMPPLKIKEFPGGTLSGGQLRGYIDSLQRLHNFVPDLVIIDYGDLMRRHSNIEIRHSIGQNFLDLRAIAQEYNIAVVSPTQTNRSGASAKLVTRKVVGEDWSKIQSADVVLTYSQTEEEERISLARIYVDKGRTMRRGQTILISQAYAIGQFALDSTIMSHGLHEKIKEAASGTD